MERIENTEDMFPVFGDFHTHSDLSDGKESPLALTAAAKQAGLSVIALTDHNRLDADLAARLSQESGITVIPGCEFSAGVVLPGQICPTEIHIIGLWLRETEEIRQLLRQNQMNDRKAYVMAWLQALDRFGIDLSPAGNHDLEQSYRQLVQENKNSSYLGRAAIANRMVEMGIAGSTGEAFYEWLGREPEDRKRIQIRSEDYLHYAPLHKTVAAIRSCPGAVAVLCHPFYNIPAEQVEWLIREFARLGGDAVEVYYSPYSDERQAYLLELAETYHLLASAGSDRHDPLRPFSKGNPEIVRCLLQRHLHRCGEP